jgi:hypothetical protein
LFSLTGLVGMLSPFSLVRDILLLVSKLRSFGGMAAVGHEITPLLASFEDSDQIELIDLTTNQGTGNDGCNQEMLFNDFLANHKCI